MSAERLSWRTEKRKVSELVKYENNPRFIKDKQFQELIKSFEKFDYVDVVIIDADNTIIGGHQRIKVLTELGRTEEELDVRVPSRKLTKNEFEELNIRLNLNRGEFDFDLLTEAFQVDNLLDYGFDKWQLGIQNDTLQLPVLPPTAQYQQPADEAATPQPVASLPTTPEGTGQEQTTASAPDQAEELPPIPQSQEEPELLFEVYLKKSLRQRLYETINQIKQQEKLTTTPEAIEYLLNLYQQPQI
jgi:hypothetical protein